MNKGLRLEDLEVYKVAMEIGFGYLNSIDPKDY
jgi:hypothetical protein